LGIDPAVRLHPVKEPLAAFLGYWRHLPLAEFDHLLEGRHPVRVEFLQIGLLEV